jgi:hypothetical protein
MLADWEPPTGGRRSRWVPVVGGLALALLVALAVRGTGGGLAGVEVGDLDGVAPAARELETREPAQGVVIRVWEVAGQVQVSASVDGEDRDSFDGDGLVGARGAVHAHPVHRRGGTDRDQGRR